MSCPTAAGGEVVRLHLFNDTVLTMVMEHDVSSREGVVFDLRPTHVLRTVDASEPTYVEAGGVEWCAAHYGIAEEGNDTWERCDNADEGDGDCDLRTLYFVAATP